ncbi:MAG: methylenetetrahydrofolate reductase C-terminal domain-containing protein [Acetobacteraceae bacterium]|nr:methylenetetrahydrofolate reductase C-terminal domain-containing protein [Acetobacteraceae bacterium]
MIVAERKPMEAVASLVAPYERILVVGCGECVTVCMAGGEKEVEVMASALRLMRGKEGRPVTVETETVQRQCEPEYLVPLDKKAEAAEVILSMGCGVGVQFLAERFAQRWVVPALDTKFAGGVREAGVWEERCGLCGDCVLHLTGGICPVIRCSKSLLNGPCGGSHGGNCEIKRETRCAWQLIYDRLKGLGRLELLTPVLPPKDWSTARDGGPRQVVREDARL